MSDLLQSDLHPDADQLSAFIEHALPEHTRRETLTHLAICPDCRAAVALSTPPIEELPAPAPAPRPWLSGWRLAWPTAAVLAAILITAVVLYKPSPAPNVAPPPTHAEFVRPPAPIATNPPASAPKIAASSTPHKSAKPSAITTRQIASLPISGREVTELNQLARSSNSDGAAIVSAAPVLDSNQAVTGARAAAVQAAPQSNGLNILQQSAAAPQPSNSSTTVNVTSASDAVTVNAAPLALAPSPSIALLTSHPLPSDLPPVSLATSGQLILALDSEHHLFLSKDDGLHWLAIPAAWQGRVLTVTLVSSPVRISAGMAQLGIAGAAPALPAATSSLTGTVVDATGAVIPNTAITLIRLDSPLTRTLSTDSNGRFLTENLPPGSYRLEAQSPGFASLNLPLTLEPSRQSTADLTLQVGAVSEAVEVQSASASPKRSLNKARRVPAPTPLFQVTTDTGEHWTSPDALAWTKK
jgi:hypothetical protein